MDKILQDWKYRPILNREQPSWKLLGYKTSRILDIGSTMQNFDEVSIVGR